MKTLRLISLSVLLILFGPMTLVSMGIVNAETLTLENCIKKALHTHPDIKQFLLQIRHSKEQIKVAKADYLPQVSFNAEYDPTKTYTMSVNGLFRTQNHDGLLAGVVLKQKIWDFSRTVSLIKAEKVQKETAGLSLKDARALLSYKLKLQYELAIVQKKAISVRKNDLIAKEILYNQAKALVRQGMKTHADETRFMSSVYVAKDNLSIAESNLAKALTILSLYIDQPISRNVTLKDNVIIENKKLNNEETMLKNSPILQSLEKNIQEKEIRYKAAKALHYGSIDAIASYQYQDSLNTYNSTMVGILFNIPLYSGGQISAKENQAIIDRQNAENQYRAKVLVVKEEFETLIIDLKRYEHTIQARSSQLKAARQTNIVVNGRYKEGLATYVEVLDARALMLDAKFGLLQAGYDRRNTINRLEYLQGMIR